MAQKLKIDVILEGIRNIMMNAYTSILIVKESLEPQNTVVIQHDEYLRYTFAIHWRMAVVELYKLFPENGKYDKFSIPQLIEDVRANLYPLKNSIDIKTLDEWDKQLLVHKDSIDTIRKLRNYFYAHTSTRYEDHKHNMSIPKVLELIQLIGAIYNELLVAINEPPYVFDVYSFEAEDFKKLMEVVHKRNAILLAYEELVIKKTKTS